MIAGNPSPAVASFQGNLYWNSDKVNLAGYNSLAAWRSTTGQETFADNPVGLFMDPLLKAPGTGEVIGDSGTLSDLDGYRLQPNSPCINKGLPLQSYFDISLVEKDFYGNQIPQGNGLDIGCNEFLLEKNQPIATPLSVTTLEETAVQFTLHATGPDIELLSYCIESEPAHGVLTGSGSTRTYTPEAGFVGVDSLVFKAFDGLFYSNPATVEFTATADIETPTIPASIWLDNNIITLAQQTMAYTLISNTELADYAILWKKAAGPGDVTFMNPTESDCPVSFSKTGHYSLSLEVRNEGKVIASETVDIEVTSAPLQTNIIRNFGFEEGMTNWINWGGNQIVINPDNNTPGLKILSTGGGCGQNVPSMPKSGRIYSLSASVYCTGTDNEWAGIGIKYFKDANVIKNDYISADSTEYSSISLQSKAPVGFTVAYVYAWKDNGTRTMVADDFKLVTNFLTNPGFEMGTDAWVNWGNNRLDTDAAEGSKALQILPAGGGRGQDVGRLVEPGQIINLAAKIKMIGNGNEWSGIGIKYYDGSMLVQEDSAKMDTSTFMPISLQSKVPVRFSSAIVYVWKDSGPRSMMVDSLSLYCCVQ